MRRGGEGARWLEDALHLLIKNLLLIHLPLSHSSSPCLQTSFIHVHPLFNLICLFSLVRTLSLFGSNLTFCDGGHVLVPFSHCWFNSQSVEAGLSGTSRLWRKKAEKKPLPPCQVCGKSRLPRKSLEKRRLPPETKPILNRHQSRCN